MENRTAVVKLKSDPDLKTSLLEFRHNLRLLLDTRYKSGLQLSHIEHEYTHWFKGQGLSLETNQKSWVDLFKNEKALQDTFYVTKKKGVMYVESSPDVLTEESMEFFQYANFKVLKWLKGRSWALVDAGVQTESEDVAVKPNVATQTDDIRGDDVKPNIVTETNKVPGVVSCVPKKEPVPKRLSKNKDVDEFKIIYDYQHTLEASKVLKTELESSSPQVSLSQHEESTNVAASVSDARVTSPTSVKVKVEIQSPKAPPLGQHKELEEERLETTEILESTTLVSYPEIKPSYTSAPVHGTSTGEGYLGTGCKRVTSVNSDDMEELKPPKAPRFANCTPCTSSEDELSTTASSDSPGENVVTNAVAHISASFLEEVNDLVQNSAEIKEFVGSSPKDAITQSWVTFPVQDRGLGLYLSDQDGTPFYWSEGKWGDVEYPRVKSLRPLNLPRHSLVFGEFSVYRQNTTGIPFVEFGIIDVGALCGKVFEKEKFFKRITSFTNYLRKYMPNPGVDGNMFLNVKPTSQVSLIERSSFVRSVLPCRDLDQFILHRPKNYLEVSGIGVMQQFVPKEQKGRNEFKFAMSRRYMLPLPFSPETPFKRRVMSELQKVFEGLSSKE